MGRGMLLVFQCTQCILYMAHFTYWASECKMLSVCYTGRDWCWRHPRTSVRNEDIPKLDASIVRDETQENRNQYSVSVCLSLQHEKLSDILFYLLPQLRDRSVWAPVFIPGRSTWGNDSTGPSPRQEHYGLSAVALGDPVLYEHQHSQRHQE